MDDFSMDSFSTNRPVSLHDSVPPTHGVDSTNVPRLQMTDDRMVETLLQMENVLNISNTGPALSE